MARNKEPAAGGHRRAGPYLRRGTIGFEFISCPGCGASLDDARHVIVCDWPGITPLVARSLHNECSGSCSAAAVAHDYHMLRETLTVPILEALEIPARGEH